MASSSQRCLFVLLLFSFTTFILAQSTCSASSPCKQGCCSKYGSCGFGPDFCSAANCVSTCNAVAECGQYAASGKTQCPLNVCCSQYGFCGTTTDFCDSKCQNGCAKVTRPSCGGASSDRRTIGYYESWSYNRKCDAWVPENINPKLWTHLNYAFALIDSNNKMASMNSFDVQLYPRVTGLKKQNPALKVFISVGGWDAGGKVFSNMVSSGENRQTFISSAISFMQSYGFDGIDIDWEYPVAPDRNGVDADLANFVTFIKELKAACGTKYGVTLTLPSSYWYLKGFDIVGLSANVDWFNFMSYDIHGTWDGNSPYTKSVVAPHTNLTEIQDGLDLLWRNNINPSKVVLGLGFYGRSFTLKDSSCKTPGCPFSGGAKPGSCTGTAGVLSNAEIQRIISSKSLTPVLDKAAGVKYMSWDNDQWVSYDDAETLQLKKTFANNQCLGGTMVWALDLDDPNGAQSMRNLNVEGLRLQGDNIDINPWYAQSKASAISSENSLSLVVFWTECLKNPTCPVGYRMLTKGHGKIFDADLGHVTADGCHGGWGGYNRALCIEENVYFSGSCDWYGKAGACKESCPKNTMLITTNSHVGTSSCNNNKFKSYCCKGIVEATSVNTCPATNANNALSGGLAKRGLYDLVGTAKECDVLTQGLYTGVGVGLTAATYLIYLHLAGTWQYSIARGWVWVPLRNLVYNAGAGSPACTSTVTEQVDFTTFTNSPKTTGCNFKKYPQACAHYLSVVDLNPGIYKTLTCPATTKEGDYRPAPALWQRQHTNAEWRYWIDHIAGEKKNEPTFDKCNRDEYPGFRFLAAALPANNQYVQWVRFIPARQNQNAGQLWSNVCTTKIQTNVQGGPINNKICTEYLSVTTTLNGFVLTAQNKPNPYIDDLLSENVCVPTLLTDDVGYALFTHDVWYGRNTNSARSSSASLGVYKIQVAPPLKNNKSPPRSGSDVSAKRWLHQEYDGTEPSNIIVDDGNVTRPATEDELFKHHGILKCKTPGCHDEHFDGHRISLLSDVAPAQPHITDALTVVATPTARVLRNRATGARLSSGPMQTAAVMTDSTSKHLRRHQHGHHRQDS